MGHSRIEDKLIIDRENFQLTAMSESDKSLIDGIYVYIYTYIYICIHIYNRPGTI